MSAFIQKEPSSSCQGSALGGEQACTNRLVDGFGEGGEHKKIVSGLPRRLHLWEETDAVQQMRDKEAQVDVAIRKLRGWLGFVVTS